MFPPPVRAAEARVSAVSAVSEVLQPAGTHGWWRRVGKTERLVQVDTGGVRSSLVASLCALWQVKRSQETEVSLHLILQQSQ
jgi:hypothetical protein